MCLSKTGLKAFMFIMGVLLFLCGGIIMGIGIWAIVDKVYISDVVGSSLFSSAAILMVVCGVFLVLLSYLGCISAISEKKILVALYALVIGLVFVLLMSAGIAAAVFQDNIEGKMKNTMRRALVDQYGYNVEYDEENEKVTNAWNLLQTRLMCCAVEDQGWMIYQSSRWFSNQYNEYEKKFVPPSCCVYEGRLKQYLNLFHCQSFAYGPPRYLTGAMNNAIHYKGCYTAAREFVSEQSSIILGIGFSFCVFLIATIVLSVIFYRKLSSGESRDFR
ncbi:hypothetical protein ACF0H5_015421 [Mactra antiquata]